MAIEPLPPGAGSDRLHRRHTPVDTAPVPGSVWLLAVCLALGMLLRKLVQRRIQGVIP